MRLAMVGSLLTLVLSACGPSAGTGADATDNACTGAETRCLGNNWQTCMSGEFVTTEECSSGCAEGVGCSVCTPGTGSCSGNTATTCLPDGSGYEDYFCDPMQGMACDVDTGVCEGACAPQNLGQSYQGCEYFPTVTGQGVSNAFEFAIAVANPSGQTVTVTVEDGALTAPITFDVTPDNVAVRKLPWVEPLKLCNMVTPTGCSTPSTLPLLATKGAYRVRTTGPVTVYQFSPLDYTDGVFDFTYTNDASLLLPANALTGNYVVATLPFWPDGPFPSLFAVTATRDATMVTISTTANVVAGTGTPAFNAGVPTQIALNTGDVVQLQTLTGDLTGTRVQANLPVQVIGAHYGIFIPTGTCCADHLEESMVPIESLSTDYIVTGPAVPALPNGKTRLIRIIATEPDTTVSYEPPISGAATTLALAGDFIDVQRQAGDHLITANHKILVAEFMEGQDAGGSTGDPAMAIAVPTDQYRTDYLFHAPTNYEVNYVNVTAPSGATVILDGTPVTGFTPVGSSGYSAARVTLNAGLGGVGNHSITSSEPFGITVYGYGQYTSYWYPGGLDLDPIVID